MNTTKGIILVQSVMSDAQMRDLNAKRADVFARLRAIGVEVSGDTHDALSLTIPDGKEKEAYDIYKELLPSGEPGLLSGPTLDTDQPRTTHMTESPTNVPVAASTPATPPVWLVTWAITEYGAEDHGEQGVYATKELAQRHALLCVSNDWVQGHWDAYPAAAVAKLRDAVAVGDYAAALAIWDDMPTSFEVEVKPMEIDATSIELTLEDLGLDVDLDFDNNNDGEEADS